MLRTIEIDLTLQPLIDGPPMPTDQLHKTACQGDKVTIDTWKDTWVKNYKSAKDHFGSFSDKSYGHLHGLNRHRPAIVVGSGPSLKNSLEALRKNQESEHPVLVISCLHNFGYLLDEGIRADYWLSLDSGSIVMDDVSESRKRKARYYWEKTKDQKLLAVIASDPKLWNQWKGDVYLFNSLVPDMGIRDEFAKIERMPAYISSGGNAGGAAMYCAKAVMGSSTIIYVGFDFCFDYNNTFHSYPTATYDNVGKYVMANDIYGIARKTFPSYLNFKYWLDKIACTIPGEWISCSEGLLGAYKEGNIRQFKYLSLDQALAPYLGADQVFLETRKRDGVIEKKDSLKLKDLFLDPQYPHDVTLF